MIGIIVGFRSAVNHVHTTTVSLDIVVEAIAQGWTMGAEVGEAKIANGAGREDRRLTV